MTPPPQAVCRLLGLFPDREFSQLLDWVYKLSRNTKTSYRVFMLDLVGEIMEKPLRKPSTFNCLQTVIYSTCTMYYTRPHWSVVVGNKVYLS